MKPFLVLLLAIAAFGCGEKTARVIDFTVRPAVPSGDMTLSKAHAGKPVMVYVWATWCGPCKKFAPELNKIAKEYKEKGVVFLAVAQDKYEDVVEAERKEPHDMGVYTDDYGSLSNYLDIKSLPTLILLNSKHELIWQQAGVDPDGGTSIVLKQELDDVLN